MNTKTLLIIAAGVVFYFWSKNQGSLSSVKGASATAPFAPSGVKTASPAVGTPTKGPASDSTNYAGLISGAAQAAGSLGSLYKQWFNQGTDGFTGSPLSSSSGVDSGNQNFDFFAGSGVVNPSATPPFGSNYGLDNPTIDVSGLA